VQRLAVAALCAAVSLACATPAGATDIYVALGDSYTAGPLILNPKGDPIDCGRSDHNYPTYVAGVIAPAEFRDVSCGSAQTKHMTQPQGPLPLGGTNPPQFGALTPDVDLVTVGIGGNDMGFGDIVETCATLALRSGGAGKPCTDRYTVGGVDRIGERLDNVVAPRLLNVIDGIQQRSPQARVVVVGDPDPVPQPPGCFPAVPLAAGDLPFLHGVAMKLHQMKVRVAAEGGAEFVDLLTRSAGHDICQPPGAKWYEGVLPTAPAYPAHPNTLGMEYAAGEVLAALARPIPNEFTVVRRLGTRSGVIVLLLRAPYRGTFDVAATTSRGRYRAAHAFARRAGALTVRLRPSRAVRAAVRRGSRMRAALTVSFTPVAGERRTRATALTLRPPARERQARRAPAASR
jgi:hypothetical protein